MKPFVDTGFFLTLLVETAGSPKAWQTVRRLNQPLGVTKFQLFSVENRLRREIESPETTPIARRGATLAIQNLHWYLEQQVFGIVRVDYDIAIDQAAQWQRNSMNTASALLLLWPAFAVVSGSTHFLSFDPRTRDLARSSGLVLLPEQI